MLVISEEEMEVFEQAGLIEFENSMVDHIKEYFPNHYKIGGEPVVRQVISHGIRQAKSYELVSERDVCLYLTVMFMLGSGFDSDPMYPWANDILGNDALPPSAKADKLADMAVDFMDEICGPKNMYMNLAIFNLREALLEIRSRRKLDKSDQDLKEALARIYPAKYQRLGSQVVEALIETAMDMASSYDIVSARGHALFTGLMFVLGGTMDKDPFLPWLKTILNDESIENEDARVDCLCDGSIVFLDKWLKQTSQGVHADG